MTDLLNDITVVELASVLAGPLAGSFFAEHGAHVIKVENKGTFGDVTRQWRLPTEESTSSISAYYASANYGKDIVYLDLSDEEDYDKLIEIIGQADVVVSNFQKKTALKLRVDYESIVHHKCDIIFAQLVAYAWDDPRPGYDLVMQAEAGFISMNGSVEGELAKMPVALIDVIAGHQIKESVLLAMCAKMKHGKGAYIEVSLFKSAISGLANQASNYLMCEHVAKPMGTLHPNIAPYGDMVVTKDQKKLILAIGSDKQFEKLGKTLKLASELLHTFRFNKSRVINRVELMFHIRAKIEALPFNILEMSLKNANIPFCLISSMDEVFENPLAKEMVVEETIEHQKTLKVSNSAFTIKMSETSNS
ncbi:MAG: CoA transferase [Saprospiraceae bacterium]|nr:CoA transferase [Saprospiraceae bacterium]